VTRMSQEIFGEESPVGCTQWKAARRSAKDQVL